MSDDFWERQQRRREERRWEERRLARLDAWNIAARDRARAIEQLKREGEINRLNAEIENRAERNEKTPVSNETNLRSEKQTSDGSGIDSVNGSYHLMKVEDDLRGYDAVIKQADRLLSKYDELIRKIVREPSGEKPASDE